MWEATKALILICTFIQNNGFFDGCKDKSDIVFLIDDSDSISRVQFEKVKYFIKRVLLPANIDSGNVRVGILLFNSDVRVEFDLNTYTSKRELFQHVDSIIPRIGGTNTAEALRVMNEEMFSQSKGDRNNVQNIAILVTDGRSRIVTETISRAKQARQNGVHIIVIGIGDVFDVEIREIASMPSIENAFILEGFAQLRRFKDDFFKFCEVVDPRTSCYDEVSSETMNMTIIVCTVYNVWKIQCKDIAWQNSDSMAVRMDEDPPSSVNCTVEDKMTLTTSMIVEYGQSNWTAIYSPMKKTAKNNENSGTHSTRNIGIGVELLCLLYVLGASSDLIINFV